MEESGSDHALATLMILSYGTDMEIRKESGLLEALTRLIHHGRGFPHPPSIILDGIASESVPGAPQTTSRAKKLKDEEQCCSRVYQDLLCASNAPSLHGLFRTRSDVEQHWRVQEVKIHYRVVRGAFQKDIAPQLPSSHSSTPRAHHQTAGDHSGESETAPQHPPPP